MGGSSKPPFEKGGGFRSQTVSIDEMTFGIEDNLNTGGTGFPACARDRRAGKPRASRVFP
jgi:hypothetical protein